MGHRRIAVVLILAVLSAACSFGAGGNSPATPSSTPTTAVQLQSTTSARQAAAPTATSTATVLPSTATPLPTTTPLPTAAPTQAPVEPDPTPTVTPTETPPSVKENFGPSKEAEEFAGRLVDAIFALEDLPGYTYTITDTTSAPGLVLRGRVASENRREWMVHEQGFPNHVIARWVLLGDEAYTDMSGRWERTEELPFDLRSPISFGKGYSAVLFQSYGGSVSGAGRKNTRVVSRPAVRYDLERNFEEDFGSNPSFPGPVSSKASDRLWVAKEGGFLLRYQGSKPFSGPEPGGPFVEVTPLAAPPEITAPDVGARVFRGNPPPWRALTVGRERLEQLRSYAFRGSEDDGRMKFEAEGRVSDTQGRVSGTLPDFVSVFQDFDPDSLPGPEDLKTVNVDVIYQGTKIWARVGNGRWRRVVTGAVIGAITPEINAASLLATLPGGAPKGLLDEQFAEGYEEYVFGMETLFSSVTLKGGKLIGTETINGVRALHYRGTNSGDPSLPAEIWLAAGGLYLVRVQASTPAEVGDPFEAPPTPGKLKPGTTRIDILEVNKPFTVTPPVRRR